MKSWRLGNSQWYSIHRHCKNACHSHLLRKTLKVCFDCAERGHLFKTDFFFRAIVALPPTMHIARKKTSSIRSEANFVPSAFLAKSTYTTATPSWHFGVFERDHKIVPLRHNWVFCNESQCGISLAQKMWAHFQLVLLKQ